MRAFAILVALASAPPTCSGFFPARDDAAEAPVAPRRSVPATAEPEPPPGYCDDLLMPPPGAVRLCGPLIENGKRWRSYATTEARPLVNERYHERAGRCRAGLTFKPPIFSVTQGASRLSTHEIAPSGYPTCAKAPSPEHKTVIVISTEISDGG